MTVTHTALAPRNAPSPGKLGGAGHVFEVTATNAGGQVVQPAQPYTITIGCTYGQVGSVIEGTLALYAWDGNTWKREPTSQSDAGTKTLTAAPNHFSVWAVLGEVRQIFLPVIVRSRPITE